MRFSEAMKKILSVEGKDAAARITYHDGRRTAAEWLQDRLPVEVQFEYELENRSGRKVPCGYRPVIGDEAGGYSRIWNIVDMRTGEAVATVEIDETGTYRPRPERNKVTYKDFIDTHRCPWWLWKG